MYIKEGLKDGVVDPGAEHYEEKFEFPFWVMVKEYAEKHDVSYSDAAAAVVHDYSKTLKIRDEEWTDAQIAKAESEGFAEVKTYEGREGQTETYKLTSVKE